jgi:putative endonuclease
MEKVFCVYIMTNQPRGTLYIGVTSDLPKRVWQHKNKVVEGFTAEYELDQLVYYERCSDAEQAILREKRLKNWKRQWKLQLIENNNPKWDDLYEEVCRLH